MEERKTSLARLQSILTNYSVTLSSANASLLELNDQLADVWKTLASGQVDRPFTGYFFLDHDLISYRYSIVVFVVRLATALKT